jgi:hypothetical protein
MQAYFPEKHSNGHQGAMAYFKKELLFGHDSLLILEG